MRGLRLSASCLIRNSFGQQASSTKRTCFCFAFLILHLYLHWRLGALTLISSKEPLTQRSTGPFLACCFASPCTKLHCRHSTASFYIVCPTIFMCASIFSCPFFVLLFLLLHAYICSLLHFAECHRAHSCILVEIYSLANLCDGT